jgi:hypothetical protein
MFRRIAAEATYCCKLGIKLPGSAGKKVVFITNQASYSGICNKLGIKLPRSAGKQVIFNKMVMKIFGYACEKLVF